MTREEAQLLIQRKLVEMEKLLEEQVIPIAVEHQLEIESLGMTYRLFPIHSKDKMEVWDKQDETWIEIPRPPAKRGLLVSDEVWESSEFACSSEYWSWQNENWPSGEDD